MQRDWRYYTANPWNPWPCGRCRFKKRLWSLNPECKHPRSVGRLGRSLLRASEREGFGSSPSCGPKAQWFEPQLPLWLRFRLWSNGAATAYEKLKS